MDDVEIFLRAEVPMITKLKALKSGTSPKSYHHFEGYLATWEKGESDLKATLRTTPFKRLTAALLDGMHHNKDNTIRRGSIQLEGIIMPHSLAHHDGSWSAHIQPYTCSWHPCASTVTLCDGWMIFWLSDVRNDHIHKTDCGLKWWTHNFYLIFGIGPRIFI